MGIAKHHDVMSDVGYDLTKKARKAQHAFIVLIPDLGVVISAARIKQHRAEVGVSNMAGKMTAVLLIPTPIINSILKTYI